MTDVVTVQPAAKPCCRFSTAAGSLAEVPAAFIIKAATAAPV